MIINTTSAPEAIGPYSQAIKVENHIYRLLPIQYS